MSIDMNDCNRISENIPTDTDAYYESIACREEIYLETIEEMLRAILVWEDPMAYEQEETVCVDCCFTPENLDKDLDRAAEELITGDSDDPPLSGEEVAELLRATSNSRRMHE